MSIADVSVLALLQCYVEFRMGLVLRYSYLQLFNCYLCHAAPDPFGLQLHVYIFYRRRLIVDCFVDRCINVSTTVERFVSRCSNVLTVLYC